MNQDFQLIEKYADEGAVQLPIDREERMFREYVGSFSCLVADKADYVYRVVCGLAQEIKGK